MKSKQKQQQSGGVPPCLILQTEEPMDTCYSFFQDIPPTTLSIDQPIQLQELIQEQKHSRPKHEEASIKTIKSSASSYHQQQMQSIENTNLEHNVSSKQNFSKRLRFITSNHQQNSRIKTKKTKRYNNQKIKSQRVSNICQNVIQKLKRNNQYSKPVSDQELNGFEKEEKASGLVFNQNLVIFWDCLGSIVMMAVFLTQSLSLVFQQINSSKLQSSMLCFGLFYFLLDIAYNMLAVRRYGGRRIVHLKAIALHYLNSYFLIDIVIVFCMTLTLISHYNCWQQILVTSFLFKTNHIIQKFRKIQILIVQNLYYQKYWSLIKIILFNFAFAHFIAILLNLMAQNYPANNWQTVKGIQNSVWYERYIWSYYWATTIMLTVGFGDITPTTYQQALYIIFIEIVSCIAFSYNISCLGKLISKIRQQSEQIDKNRKIFCHMVKANNLSDSLVEKVQNYIDESVELQNRFNIQEEKCFIQNLPSGYKKQVISQSNISLLKDITFFGQLLRKTVHKLSDKIQRQIYSPDQIIKNAGIMFGVYILQNGEIGYSAKKPGYKFNKIVVNRVRVQHERPFLIDLDFITRKNRNYQVKSLGYSIVHKVSYQKFITELQSVPKDYQYYCFLKDKSKHIIDQHQTVPCVQCKTNHTYFDCPKFHYIPIRQHVTHKSIKQLRKAIKNKSIPVERQSNLKASTLKTHHSCHTAAKDYIRITSHPSKNRLSDQRQLLTSLLKNFHYMKEQAIVLQQQSMQNDNVLRLINQMIKVSVNQHIKLQEHHDQVWELTTDCVQNYDIYFPEGNSYNLKNRVKFEKKSQAEKERKKSSVYKLKTKASITKLIEAFGV